jgi:putative chitinase
MANSWRTGIIQEVNILTQEILKKIAPGARADVVAALLKQETALSEKYSIDTVLRMAHFLAQTAQESAGFTATQENLNYRVQALKATFGSRITAAQAARVGRNDATGQKANQAAIADIVYGGAWGAKNLGNTQSGDGSKFIGRGLIQITGRSNYIAAAKVIRKSLDDVIAYLETPDGAVESAAWFWNSHKLNDLADDKDIDQITKVITGGDIGLADRKNYLKRATAALPAGLAVA